MKLGIIGLPQSGKTTLFQILTQSVIEPTGKIENRFGVIRIADLRLDRLSEMIHPKKTTAATFEVVDSALGFPATGPKPKGDTDPHAELRQSDVLILVVRAFASDTVAHPHGSVDADRDRSEVEQELILSDLVQLETRLKRIEKMAKVGRKSDSAQELPVLRRIKDTLEAGTPIRELELTAQEDKLIRGYAFLSATPLLILYNVGEGQSVEMGSPGPHSGCVSLPAKAELEVSRLPEEERAAFRDLFSISEAGLDTLLNALHQLLGLLTFFTAGEPEVRAWHLGSGNNAVVAAGKIHSDIARGFIRAEVVNWEKLLEAGAWGATRDKGWLRTEGKEYIIQDGDCLHILFNV